MILKGQSQVFKWIILGSFILIFGSTSNIVNAKDITLLPYKQWQKDENVYRPYPILFFHGFAGGTPDAWDDARMELSPYFKNYYMEEGKSLEDVYLVAPNFSDDPNGTIDGPGGSKGGWSLRVEDEASKFLEKPDDRILFVCHSMGGLAAREALSNSVYDTFDKAEKLITMGTPHLGSPAANIANALSRSRELGWYVPVYGWGFSIFISLFDKGLEASKKIDIDGDAVEDMDTKSDFIERLNDPGRRSTPSADFFAIYGRIWSWRNLFLFWNFRGGDGVVSVESQRADGVGNLNRKDTYEIKASHDKETLIAVNPENFPQFFNYLDSTPPEFKKVYPTLFDCVTDTCREKPEDMTEEEWLTRRLKRLIDEGYIDYIIGEVDKEYLPADTRVEFRVYKDGSEEPIRRKLYKEDKDGNPIDADGDEKPDPMYLSPYENKSPTPAGLEEEVSLLPKDVQLGEGEELEDGIYTIKTWAINPAIQRAREKEKLNDEALKNRLAEASKRKVIVAKNKVLEVVDEFVGVSSFDEGQTWKFVFKLTVQNNSEYPMKGTLRLLWEDMEGVYHPLKWHKDYKDVEGSEEFEIELAGKTKEGEKDRKLTDGFALTIADLANLSRYILVFRGTIGEEEAVTARVFKPGIYPLSAQATPHVDTLNGAYVRWSDENDHVGRPIVGYIWTNKLSCLHSGKWRIFMKFLPHVSFHPEDMDDIRAAKFKYSFGGVVPIQIVSERVREIYERDVTVDIHKVNSALWDEETITWNNQPDSGESLASKLIPFIPSGGEPYEIEIDITDYVKEVLSAGQGDLSIVIKHWSEGYSSSMGDAGAEGGLTDDPVVFWKYVEPGLFYFLAKNWARVEVEWTESAERSDPLPLKEYQSFPIVISLGSHGTESGSPEGEELAYLRYRRYYSPMIIFGEWEGCVNFTTCTWWSDCPPLYAMSKWGPCTCRHPPVPGDCPSGYHNRTKDWEWYEFPRLRERTCCHGKVCFTMDYCCPRCWVDCPAICRYEEDVDACLDECYDDIRECNYECKKALIPQCRDVTGCGCWVVNQLLLCVYPERPGKPECPIGRTCPLVCEAHKGRVQCYRYDPIADPDWDYP